MFWGAIPVNRQHWPMRGSGWLEDIAGWRTRRVLRAGEDAGAVIACCSCLRPLDRQPWPAPSGWLTEYNTCCEHDNTFTTTCACACACACACTCHELCYPVAARWPPSALRLQLDSRAHVVVHQPHVPDEPVTRLLLKRAALLCMTHRGAVTHKDNWLIAHVNRGHMST